MNTLYTLGYANWSAAQVAGEVRQRDGLVVDVRLVPFTEKPGFSKGDLSAQLGQRYVHLEELGNASYQEDAIEIRDLDVGLHMLETLAEERAPESFLLMCGCKDWRTCHRRVVAEAAAKRLGTAIQHLEPPHLRAQTELFPE